jgi:hypothetical protein
MGREVGRKETRRLAEYAWEDNTCCPATGRMSASLMVVIGQFSPRMLVTGLARTMCNQRSQTMQKPAIGVREFESTKLPCSSPAWLLETSRSKRSRNQRKRMRSTQNEQNVSINSKGLTQSDLFKRESRPYHKSPSLTVDVPCTNATMECHPFTLHSSHCSWSLSIVETTALGTCIKDCSRSERASL